MRRPGSALARRPREFAIACGCFLSLLVLLFASRCRAQVPPTSFTDNGAHATGVHITNTSPLSVTGSLSVSGAANTTGLTVSFNGNSVCAVVPLTGQPAAGVHIAAGTLATTLTAALSDNATPSTSGCPGGATCTCTGGTYPTPAKFIDNSGNTATSLVLSNPNGELQYGLSTVAGAVCAEVCTASSGTTGSASVFLQATVATNPPPAAGADVTDRWGRQLGQVDLARVLGAAMALTNPVFAELSDGTNALGGAAHPVRTDPTGTTPQPVTGTFWQGTQPVSLTTETDDPASTAAASESATTRLSATTVLRGLDTAQTAGSQLVPIKATGNALWMLLQNSSIAVTGTFWQATQPVSVASLPLPSGAATAANQTAVQGTAGSPSTTVETVQGVAGGTPVPMSAASLPLPSGAATSANQTNNSQTTQVVNGSGTQLLTDDAAASSAASESATVRLGIMAGLRAWDSSQTAGSQLVPLKATGNALWVNLQNGSIAVTGTFWQATQPVSGSVTANIGTTNGLALDSTVSGLQVSQGSTTSGQKGSLAQGAVTTAAPSYTTGQTAPLSLDPSGNLRVVQSGGGSNAAAGSTGAAVPSSADYTGFNSGGNLVGVSTANPLPTTFAGIAQTQDADAGTTLQQIYVADFTGNKSVKVTNLPWNWNKTALQVETNNKTQNVNVLQPNGFRCSADTISAATQLSCPTPNAGQSYYVTSVLFSTSAAITFTATSSTTANNACATAPSTIVPTSWFAANSGVPITFNPPVRIAPGSVLCCTPSGASGSCLFNGYIQ